MSWYSSIFYFFKCIIDFFIRSVDIISWKILPVIGWDCSEISLKLLYMFVSNFRQNCEINDPSSACLSQAVDPVGLIASNVGIGCIDECIPVIDDCGSILR